MDERQKSAGPLHRVEVAARWVAVLVAVVGTLAITRNGLIVSPDSTRYLAGAEGLVGGDGLVGPTGDPLVLFPPGTSMAYSIGEILPVETLTWVRVLNSFLAGAAVLVTSSIVSRHVGRVPVEVVASLFTGAAVGLFAVTRAAWSEPIYVLLAVLFVALLVDVVADPAPPTWRLALLVAVVWAACLTRYAGFVLIPVAGLSIALFGPGRAVRRAGVVALAAASVPLAWLLFNRFRAGSFVGERPPSTDTFPATVRRIVEVVGGWLVPSDVVDGAGIRFVAGVAIGSTLLVAAFVGIRAARAHAGAVASGPIVAGSVAALTALAGMAMVGITQLRTAIDPADARLLAPALLPGIIAVAVTVDRAPRPGRLLASVGVVAAVVVVAAQAVGAYRFIDGTQPEQWTYTHPIWTGSEVAAAVADLPDDATIITNDPFAVWALTDRRDIDESPRSGEYRSDVVTPFPDEFGVSCSPSYLVWFEQAAVFHHPPARIAEAVPFAERIDLGDGQIARFAEPGRCR